MPKPLVLSGESIHATWLHEKTLLRPLPATLSEPFDLIKQAQVHKDCTIRFEGKTLTVPYRFAYRTVEVRGCAHVVQIVDPKTGQIVQEFPRNARSLVQIDPSCYEPSESEEENPFSPKPLPLGAIARHVQELASQGAPRRSIEYYESLATMKAASQK